MVPHHWPQLAHVTNCDWWRGNSKTLLHQLQLTTWVSCGQWCGTKSACLQAQFKTSVSTFFFSHHSINHIKIMRKLGHKRLVNLLNFLNELRGENFAHGPWHNKSKWKTQKKKKRSGYQGVKTSSPLWIIICTHNLSFLIFNTQKKCPFLMSMAWWSNNVHLKLFFGGYCMDSRLSFRKRHSNLSEVNV